MVLRGIVLRLMHTGMQAFRQAVYIRPITLIAVSRSSILVKSIETCFGCLFWLSLLDILALVVYSSQV